MGQTRRHLRRTAGAVSTLVMFAAGWLVLPLGNSGAWAAAAFDYAEAETFSRSCDSGTSDPCDESGDPRADFTDSFHSDVSTGDGTASGNTSQTTTLTQEGGALTTIDSVSHVSTTASGAGATASGRSSLHVRFSVPAGGVSSVSMAGTLNAGAGDGERDCGQAVFEDRTGFEEAVQYRVAQGCSDPTTSGSLVINETVVLNGGEFGGSFGFVWSALSSGSAEASWDFTISLSIGDDGLEGSVTDGQGEPMVGVAVDLLDQSETPVATTVTDALGHYTFDPSIAADDYILRVTLIDAESDPPRIRTFFNDGSAPVHVDRAIGAPDFDGPIDFGITRDPSLASNIPEHLEDFLTDIAVIHRRSKQYVDFLTETFEIPPPDFGQVSIRTFATPAFAACPPENTCYYKDHQGTATAMISASYSFTTDRDELNDEGPESVEWHELTHHFEEIQGLYPSDCLVGVDDDWHKGWTNESSCPAFTEGFAEFLPAYASRVIDGATDDTFATAGSLEWNSWKAWSNNEEELGVASMLWDLADAESASGSDNWISHVITADANDPLVQTVYRDEVEIGFELLSEIIITSKPHSVDALHSALLASASVPQAFKETSVDLDHDLFADVTPIDVVFLMHGFHTVDVGNTEFFYRMDTPIGRTDHVADLTTGGLKERPKRPHTAGSEVLFSNDSSEPTTATLTVSEGDIDAAYSITVPSGEDVLQRLDLPPFVSRRIEPADPLPACGDADNDAVMSITIEAPGIEPLETDSCEYAHSVGDSNGAPALTYAITPPDGTIKRPRDASALGDGIYNTTGAGQTLTTKVKRGKGGIYQLVFTNDTQAADGFTVTGCASSKGFKVSFRDDGVDVTQQVLQGRSTGELAAGATEALELRIKVGRSGPKSKSCAVSAVSQNSPALRDVLVGKVKVKS